MRTVTINMADVGAGVEPGDSVVFWSPEIKPSSVAGRVVSTARVIVFLDSNGLASVSLEPGFVCVKFRCRNYSDTATRTFFLPPGEGSISLRDALALSVGPVPDDTPVVSGSRSGGGALDSLLSALSQLGLVDDQTTE